MIYLSNHSLPLSKGKRLKRLKYLPRKYFPIFGISLGVLQDSTKNDVTSIKIVKKLCDVQYRFDVISDPPMFSRESFGNFIY